MKNRVGFDLDFITKPVEDVVSSVVDFLGDGFRLLPGSNWVEKFLDNASKPLKDFAKSGPGQVVFRAMATMIYGPLAWTIGPQVAAVAFALPGLIRGEPFDKAFWEEFSWRVQKTGEILGADAGKAAADALKVGSESLINDAKQAFPDLPQEVSVDVFMRQTGLTPEKLAEKLGIAPIDAAAAINLALRQIRYPLSGYDITTGRKLVTRTFAQTTSTSSVAKPISRSLAQAIQAPSVAKPSRQSAMVDQSFFVPTEPRQTPPGTFTTSPDGGEENASAKASTTRIVLFGVGVGALLGGVGWFVWKRRR